MEGTLSEEEIIKVVKDYLTKEIGELTCVIIPRNDTSSNWTLNNPTLENGEYGVETDTHRVKRGDGVTVWDELPYETFGVEAIIKMKAADVSFDNTNAEITKINVQDVLDYLVERVKTLNSKLEEKEMLSNKVTEIKEENDKHAYPTSEAVMNYVGAQKSAIETKYSFLNSPGDSGTYTLQIKDGQYVWTPVE